MPRKSPPQEDCLGRESLTGMFSSLNLLVCLMSSSRSVAGDANCSPRVNLRTLAIINASSGRGSSDPRDRLCEVLRARGLEWRICLARDGAELAGLARE